MTYKITVTEKQLEALKDCLEYLRNNESPHFDECEANDEDTSLHIFKKVLIASEAIGASESEGV